MKLFIIDLWIPFPASEYGGIIILKANTVNEAIELLSNYNRINYDFNPEDNDKNKIIEAVNNAINYEIMGEHNVGIVTSFIT